MAICHKSEFSSLARFVLEMLNAVTLNRHSATFKWICHISITLSLGVPIINSDIAWHIYSCYIGESKLKSCTQLNTHQQLSTIVVYVCLMVWKVTSQLGLLVYTWNPCFELFQIRKASYSKMSFESYLCQSSPTCPNIWCCPVAASVMIHKLIQFEWGLMRCFLKTLIQLLLMHLWYYQGMGEYITAQ